MEVRTERLPVCNLTVERIHCYTVGDVGVLVHNKPQKYDGGGSDERPPNLSPPGAKRRGAFREAKRRNNIPQGQQPSRVKPNLDKRGNPQPGKQYEFDTPEGTKTIRDDAGGHRYPDDPTQDRGPHFNDDAGNHYDY
ncbi:MAG: type IV secretion protein Rhs [Planctomycetota bacterium]|nr:MAG: type IV secretion protein Rhs [Planctomycetota bacterium]REJ88041.1 MAG: type IV secretion protein Rhs [Planctomycetota bacterium]REK27113.1 MAG: type IV secretion protein Rhs [Planctomycetota bacterium]REK38254.1 MAG: type IV secretion protein Rhs [Planctomycetota bacterium]